MRRVEHLTDMQVAVLAAVERLGEATLGDLYQELPFVNVLRLADEVDGLEHLGLVQRADVGAGPWLPVDALRWTPAPIRR